MDRRVIRRFGRASHKNLKFLLPAKGLTGLLTYNSYNWRWTITIDMLVNPTTVTAKPWTDTVEPWSGRVTNRRTGETVYWARLESGRIMLDRPESLPVYVRHAIKRIAAVGVNEIGKRSQKRLIAFRRATL